MSQRQHVARCVLLPTTAAPCKDLYFLRRWVASALRWIEGWLVFSPSGPRWRRSAASRCHGNASAEATSPLDRDATIDPRHAAPMPANGKWSSCGPLDFAKRNVEMRRTLSHGKHGVCRTRWWRLCPSRLAQPWSGLVCAMRFCKLPWWSQASGYLGGNPLDHMGLSVVASWLRWALQGPRYHPCGPRCACPIRCAFGASIHNAIVGGLPSGFDGMPFVGAFRLESLRPSLEPYRCPRTRCQSGLC